MAKYETGLHKGEEIMIECDKGRHWTDHGNNIFIEHEFDADWKELGTFRVAERLRENRHHIWVNGQSFEDALDLAERLVIGKDYVPLRRSTPILTEPEFNVDDVLSGYIHNHRFRNDEPNPCYDPEVKNPIKYTGVIASLLYDKLSDAPTGRGKILEISKDGKLTIGYFYAGYCYTGELVRK